MNKKTAKSMDSKIEEISPKTDYIDDLKRLQADFENFIKRTNKEKDEVSMLAKAKLILKLTSVIDNFDHAIDSMKNDKNSSEILKGVELIYNQFSKILHEDGLRLIEAKGKKFDYNTHEVIKQIEHEAEEGIVLDEIQKGYIYNNKILRPSKVIISKGVNKNV